MNSLEAKDFLVQETAKQAMLERVPFSDLERRMMYFTEVQEMREDPIKLNDEFGALYDSDEYEAKISKLMDHSYARVKKENPETAQQWNEAIRELSKGDHYILVLWGEGLSTKIERPPYDSLKLLGTALLVIVGGGAIIFGITAVSHKYGIHWPEGGLETHSPMPPWLQRFLFGLVVGGYVYYVVLPRILKRRLPGIAQLLLKLLAILMRSTKKEGT